MRPNIRRTLAYPGKLVALLGLRQAASFLLQWVAGPSDTIEVAPVGTNMRLLVRRFTTDINVLWQVFVRRDVDLDLVKKPRLIIDAGAHAGYTTAFFAARYPAAQIIAVEPDRANCELLRTNCRVFPNVTLVQAGIWTSNADLAIENPRAAPWALRLREALPTEQSTLRGITIEEILNGTKMAAIDILKLDIEGAEKRIFASGCDGWLAKVGTVIVEPHGQDCEEDIEHAARAYGFAVSRRGERMVLVRGTCS